MVREYSAKQGANTIDKNTARNVIEFDEPQSNHNGGDLAFGHDAVMTEPFCVVLSPKVQSNSVGFPIDRSVKVTATILSTPCSVV